MEPMGRASGVGGVRTAACRHDVAAADHIEVQGGLKRKAATPPQADGTGAAGTEGLVATPCPAVAPHAATPPAVRGPSSLAAGRRRLLSHAGETLRGVAHHDEGHGAAGDVGRERALGVPVAHPIHRYL